jgi:hypothetical protein
MLGWIVMVPRHSYRIKSANDFKPCGFPGEKAKIG